MQLREDKKSETRNSSVWLTDSEPLRDVVKETAWALSDGAGPFTVQLPIVDGRHAGGHYMQMSGDVFIPAQEGLVEQVLGQLAGHKSLGVRRSERFLPQNTQITAIGELNMAVDHPGAFKGAHRSHGKMCVLQQPRKGPFLLSRQRFPDIIASTQATSLFCAELSAWFTAAGTSMLIAVAWRKIWVWRQEQKMQQRVKEVRMKRAAIKASSHEDKAEEANRESDEAHEVSVGMCVVCFERDSEMVYPNCGHLCACATCGRMGTAMARCPICRSRGSPIRVFRT